MSEKLRAGIIGSGNISTSYLRLAPLFHGVEIVSCADIDMAAAEAQAGKFNIGAVSVDEMLSTDDIDIVVNLTIPAAHFEVSSQVLAAGKHVYSEKPFVLSVEEGMKLAALAKEKNRRIGSAPDTFFGGSHQLARHLIDSGVVGKVTSGTCHVMSHGMEHWHPNPDFFFKPGGGPILDLGPYYITNLVQLLGPARRVSAVSSTPASERVISSQPRAGERIPVETPTTIHSIMEFASGAVVTLGASWDVWDNRHSHMELYGETGSLYLPDPNFFGGEVECVTSSGGPADIPDWDHPFSQPNQEHSSGSMANYRAAGLADMALAIIEGRPHRCSGDLALHVVDIMTSILMSGEQGQFVTLRTTCERPAAFGIEEARGLLAAAPEGMFKGADVA
ncbi:MAG: Gfo/Idh/MocA family protein [Rhizobiaceae bacterium]